MKVTISDVARLAGVSTATVSHTINNTRYVSGETKEKVYQAIKELGYTPDASARSFRTGKKKTIGFIVPDISNKFFANMIEAVEHQLSARGYHLIIANTKENMEREENTIRLLTAGLVDGLLIASTIDDFARFDSLIPAGFPVVLVDRTFEEKKYSSICVSNFQPIYRSVCRLAGKGARRVGIIGGLALGCDALIVCQGLMSLETISYLNLKNIRLAEDIDLVSFVDYDYDFYQLYSSRMDSIIQPVEELGIAAGEQILRRVEEPEAPVFEKVLTSAYKPCGLSAQGRSDR